MTNEEKLKSLNTEELADRLAALTEYQDISGTHYTSPDGWELTFDTARKAWLKWLKEEVK